MVDEPPKTTPPLIVFELWAVVALMTIPTLGPAIDWIAVFKNETLVGWQTSIAAIIGFFALAGAALYNAHLNRRRDDRLRNIDACALVGALAAELSSLKDEANRNVKIMRGIFERRADCSPPFPVSLLETMALQRPVVFEDAVSKLSLLGSEIVEDLIKAYQEFRLFNYAIDHLVQRAVSEALLPKTVEVFEKRTQLATDLTDLVMPKLHGFRRVQL